MKKASCFVSFLLLFTLLSFQNAAPKVPVLINQMLEAGRKINTLKFTLVKNERVEGKMMPEKSFVKLQNKPLKIYLKQEAPHANLEVLYVAGQNNNEAYVQTNGFPWKTFSFSPQSSTMRSGQHHSLLDVGFGQILTITEHIIRKYKGQTDEMLKLDKTVAWQGLTCYQVKLTNPNFKYVDYTVGSNENLLTIAAKFNVNEFMILEKNPGIKSYTSVSAGQKIKMPTDYAKEISMLIDQKTSLPVVVKIYDDKGLFEHYEYQNLQVNPVIREAEFSKTYSGYNF